MLVGYVLLFFCFGFPLLEMAASGVESSLTSTSQSILCATEDDSHEVRCQLQLYFPRSMYHSMEDKCAAFRVRTSWAPRH